MADGGVVFFLALSPEIIYNLAKLNGTFRGYFSSPKGSSCRTSEVGYKEQRSRTLEKNL